MQHVTPDLAWPRDLRRSTALALALALAPRRTAIVASLMATAALWAGGCGEPAPVCTRDSDCGFGSICGDGACAPGCRENGDCPLGQPCLDGVCSDERGTCNGSFYCDYGELCDVERNECAYHAQADLMCRRAYDRFCFEDADCLDGAPCVDNFCQDCGTDGVALFDRTVPFDACSTDSQCPAEGSTCSRNPCRDTTNCNEGAQCFGSYAPGGGEVVDELHNCSDGSCVRLYCAALGCSDDDPCPKGFQCLQLVANLGTCATDADCGAGRTCSKRGEVEQGFCSCLTDDDCGSGATCDDPGPNGSCIVGSVCSLQSGLTCDEVLQ